MSSDQTTSGGALAYSFGAGHAGSNEELVGLLGGKGASLVLMRRAGIPAPPGFTITTEACREFLSAGWSDGFDRAVADALAELERETGKSLGSATNPLLVSVRSGASVSMPGMMDTVLNVGMNQTVERALASQSQNPGFAAETHCRALLGFAQLVLGAPADVMDTAGDAALDPDAVSSALHDAGYVVPADPATQVTMAVRAVFESWQGARATRYREIEGIDPTLGTAATVQAMVFGNLGAHSGTGVAFSRDPTTGEPGLVGDFLVDAQGEDVVAGEAATEPLAVMASRWPALYDQLAGIAVTLEHHYQDMVDLEFTVEEGHLWLLQARRGKRSPIAAFRTAIALAEDPGFEVNRSDAVERCRRYFDDPPTITGHSDRESTTDQTRATVVAAGLGASPGYATGVLCCDPDRAVAMKEQGLDVILARQATSPADVHGMAAARGIFTTLGGTVSHAALVAREWGLPAVVGAAEATVGENTVTGPDVTVQEGEVVTVDGDTGRLLLGVVGTARVVAPEVEVVKGWAAELAPTRSDGTTAQTGPSTPEPDTESDAGTEAAPDGPPLRARVLHALRIKGMLTGPGAAAICGVTETAAEAELAAAVEQGHATFMEPRAMWLISPDGRAAHPEVLAQLIEGLDLAAMPYQRFLELNDEFKQLCTDWQLRDGEPNDHADAAYDHAIHQRLLALDDEAQPVIAEIAAVAAWMAPYRPRLAAARARLLDGDHKALTGVMCDSYHDVWMELHEDLILTQGIDRAAEGSA